MKNTINDEGELSGNYKAILFRYDKILKGSFRKKLHISYLICNIQI